jgi:hypothetical protein
VVTADTYTSVLPAAERRCADATAALVLAADGRTRRKIKNEGRKNRPGGRQKTGAAASSASRTAAKGQVRRSKPAENQRGMAAPGGHPTDTHRPQGSDSTCGLNRVSAA